MKVAFKNAFLVAAYACLVFSCTRSSVSEGEIRAKFSQLELGEDKAGLLRTYHQVKKDGDCDSVAILLRENRFAFQIIIDAFAKHGLYQRWQAKEDSATLLFDQAAQLATDYARATADSFFLYKVAFDAGLPEPALRKKLGAQIWYSNCWDNLQSYQNSSIDNELEMLLETSRQIGDRALEVDVLNFMQYRKYFLGQYTSAVALHDSILLKAHKIGYTRRKISAFYNTGMSLISLGQASEALVLLRAGMHLADMTDDEVYEKMLSGKIGNAYRRLGRFPEASDAYDLSLTLSRKSGDVSEELLVLNDASALHVNQGRYSKAKADLRHALDLAIRKDKHSNHFIILFNLADINNLLGDYPLAQSNIDSASTLYQRIEFDPHDVARYYAARAQLSYQTGDTLQAMQQFLEALQAIYPNEQGDLHLLPQSTIAEIWLNLAKIYTDQNQLDRAFQYNQKALNVFTELEYKTKIVSAQRQLGVLYATRKEFAPALKFFQGSLKSAQELKDPLQQLEAHYNLALLYKKSGNLAAAEKALLAAIEKIETTRESISENDRMSYWATRKEIFDEMVLLHFEQGAYDKAFAYSEQVRARQIRDDFQEDKASNGHAFTVAIADSDLFNMRLDKNVQALEYHVTTQKLLLFMVDNGRLSATSVDVSKDELEKEAIRFRHAIGADSRDDFLNRINADAYAEFQKGRQHAAKLYQYLIAPFADRLNPEKVLYLVPDGILYQVPFAALVKTEAPEEPYFIEQYTLASIQSLSFLSDIVAMRTRKPDDAELKILTVSNPTWDLPEAEKEAVFLASNFTNTTTLLGSAADEETVMQHLLDRSTRVVHFGAHAQIDASFPLHSFLALSGVRVQAGISANRAIDTVFDPQKNGYFTAGEIADLDLSHIQLCNLAACKTAGGRLLEGEGIVGLNWAFMKAGVPAVISSLWDVSDRYTCKLMISFYQNWLQNGANKAAALRAAQRQIIEEMHHDKLFDGLPHPFAWAAFSVFGDYHAER